MNKKFFSKLLVISLLIIIAINNISYAINIEKDKLQSSLMHMFGSDVRVKTETSKNGMTGSSTLTYRAPSELELNDDQIIMREVGEIDGQRVEVSLVMNYSINEEKANFNMKTDVKEYLKYEPEEEYALGIIGLMMNHANSMLMGYLALAENLNIDLNLAATYFDQCMPFGIVDEEEYDPNVITCDLYTRKLYFDEETEAIDSSLEINLEELSKIKQSHLDGTVETTIEFLNEYKDNGNTGNENKNESTNENNIENNTNNVVNNKANNTVNNTTNNVVNNTTNNTVNKVVNNTANNVTNKNANKVNNVTNNQTVKPVDNTTSNKIIPAAGSETICYIFISLVALSVFIYIKLRTYDDVK